VNHALQDVLPLLNSVLNASLPATIGDCRGDAPSPCTGNGPIYRWRGPATIGSQDVLVRWVTGMNTVRLNSISLHTIPDSRRPIQVAIRGTIERMKLSIRISQCLLSVCKTLWDNANGCCEPFRTFELVIATTCQAGPNNDAELGDFKVEYFNIDQVQLNEKVLGTFESSVADITPQVRNAVQKTTMDIFDTRAHRPLFLNLTFSEVVSRLWKYNTAQDAPRCSDLIELF